MFQALQKFTREEEGLTMVEYAVAGALISAAAVTAFSHLGQAVIDKIDAIRAAITG